MPISVRSPFETKLSHDFYYQVMRGLVEFIKLVNNIQYLSPGIKLDWKFLLIYVNYVILLLFEYIYRWNGVFQFYWTTTWSYRESQIYYKEIMGKFCFKRRLSSSTYKYKSTCLVVQRISTMYMFSSSTYKYNVHV
jgi:hypothetical protein